MDRIMTEFSVSVTELKKNPLGLLKKSNGEPIAVLKNNRPAGYFMPVEMFERIMDYIEDVESLKIVEERKGEKRRKVNLDDL